VGVEIPELILKHRVVIEVESTLGFEGLGLVGECPLGAPAPGSPAGGGSRTWTEH